MRALLILLKLPFGIAAFIWNMFVLLLPYDAPWIVRRRDRFVRELDGLRADKG